MTVHFNPQMPAPTLSDMKASERAESFLPTARRLDNLLQPQTRTPLAVTVNAT